MNQSERRNYLLRELMKEDGRYSDIEIPDSSEEQMHLLRGLMNIRMSKSIGDEFLCVQNEFLLEEAKEKGITEIEDLEPVQEGIYLWQGDYGLFQCSEPCHQKTYDNEKVINNMVKQQENMKIPTSLIPHCPVCGKPMTVNLRADSTFVEDEGWHIATEHYVQFLRRHENCKVLYLELGVGANTPGIIKYPFWRMTAQNDKAIYACINLGEVVTLQEIEKRSICINEDIDKVILGLS